MITRMSLVALLCLAGIGSAHAQDTATDDTSAAEKAAAEEKAAECIALAEERAELDESRAAYNGHEGHWALRDEIQALDKKIFENMDRWSELGC